VALEPVHSIMEPPTWPMPEEPAQPLTYAWKTVGPGWHDVAMNTYLGWPIVSSSLAMLLTHHEDRTPAYLHWVMTRERDDDDDDKTGARLLGSLTHTAVLEPDLLDVEYAAMPQADPNVFTTASGNPSSNPKATSAWKAKEAELAATGKTVTTHEQMQEALAMRDKVHAHPRAKQIVQAPGPVEATMVAHDPETGVLLKARADKLIPGIGWHVNFKTAGNASRNTFMRDVYNYGYYVSMALYERVLRALGWDLRRSQFLVVETAGPLEVAIYEADAGLMDAGHRVLSVVLERIAECIERDEWPGHGMEIQEEPISLPHWAWSRVEDFEMGL